MSKFKPTSFDSYDRRALAKALLKPSGLREYLTESGFGRIANPDPGLADQAKLNALIVGIEHAVEKYLQSEKEEAEAAAEMFKNL